MYPKGKFWEFWAVPVPENRRCAGFWQVNIQQMEAGSIFMARRFLLPKWELARRLL